MDRPVIAVPPIVVPKYFEPARLYRDTCLRCELVASAASEAGLMAAMEEHRTHILATADRATDPHFDDERLTALLES